jgi:hypothetical protein
MNKTYSNPCIRCGKDRIVVKTWEEQAGNSTITNREMACPDPACQKVVDHDNKKQSERNAAMKMKSEQRAQLRRAAKDAEKVAQIEE